MLSTKCQFFFEESVSILRSFFFDSLIASSVWMFEFSVTVSLFLVLSFIITAFSARNRIRCARESVSCNNWSTMFSSKDAVEYLEFFAKISRMNSFVTRSSQSSVLTSWNSLDSFTNFSRNFDLSNQWFFFKRKILSIIIKRTISLMLTTSTEITSTTFAENSILSETLFLCELSLSKKWFLDLSSLFSNIFIVEC